MLNPGFHARRPLQPAGPAPSYRTHCPPCPGPRPPAPGRVASFQEIGGFGAIIAMSSVMAVMVCGVGPCAPLRDAEQGKMPKNMHSRPLSHCVDVSVVRQLLVVRLPIPSNAAPTQRTGRGSLERKGKKQAGTESIHVYLAPTSRGRHTSCRVCVALAPRFGMGTWSRKHKTTRWSFSWSIAQQQDQFMPLPSRRLPRLITGMPSTLAALYMVQTLTAVHREGETRTKKTKKERQARMSPCQACRPPAKETIGVSEQPHHGGCELSTRMDDDPVFHQGGDGGEGGQRHAVCLKFWIAPWQPKVSRGSG